MLCLFKSLFSESAGVNMLRKNFSSINLRSNIGHSTVHCYLRSSVNNLLSPVFQVSLPAPPRFGRCPVSETTSMTLHHRRCSDKNTAAVRLLYLFIQHSTQAKDANFAHGEECAWTMEPPELMSLISMDRQILSNRVYHGCRNSHLILALSLRDNLGPIDTIDCNC